MRVHNTDINLVWSQPRAPVIPLFIASWAANASASAMRPLSSPLIFWSFSTHCFLMVGSLNEPPLLALTMRATVLLARRVDSSTKTWGAAATTGAIVFCQLAAVGLDLCSGGVQRAKRELQAVLVQAVCWARVEACAREASLLDRRVAQKSKSSP